MPSMLFYPCFEVVVIRKVAVKKRAETYKGFSEANGATAIENEVSGVAVAVLLVSCRAVHGLRFAPFAL